MQNCADECVLHPCATNACLAHQLDEGPGGEPEGTFVDYQTTMVKTAKAIAVTVQEMVRTHALSFPRTPGGGESFTILPVLLRSLLHFYLPHTLQVTKSTTNPDELGTLANQLTNEYGHLAQQAKPAAITAENEEVMLRTPQGSLRRSCRAPLAPRRAFLSIFGPVGRRGAEVWRCDAAVGE